MTTLLGDIIKNYYNYILSKLELIIKNHPKDIIMGKEKICILKIRNDFRSLKRQIN